MAITQALCTSFKQELLQGIHNFTSGSGGGTTAGPMRKLGREPQLQPRARALPDPRVRGEPTNAKPQISKP